MAAKNDTPLLLTSVLPVHSMMELEAEALNNRLCVGGQTCSGVQCSGWPRNRRSVTFQQPPGQVGARPALSCAPPDWSGPTLQVSICATWNWRACTA